MDTVHRRAALQREYQVVILPCLTQGEPFLELALAMVLQGCDSQGSERDLALAALDWLTMSTLALDARKYDG